MNRRLRSLGVPLAGLAAVFVVVLLWPRGAESQHVNCASPRVDNRCLPAPTGDPGTTINCYYCHNVHGGSGQGLKQEAVTEALCLSCHAPAGTATLKADVHTNDPQGSSNPAFRWSCRHCHTPHVANLPPNRLGTHTHPDSSSWGGPNIQLLGTNAGDNQIVDSNAFETGSWVKNNITVTADNTDDPFSNATVSSSTADKIEATVGSSSTTDIRQTSSDLGSTPGRTFTFYVWLKADTDKTVEISLLDGSTVNGSTVIGNSQVLVGTSWDRYFVRRLVPAGTSNFLTVAIGVDDNRDDGATAGEPTTCTPGGPGWRSRVPRRES